MTVKVFELKKQITCHLCGQINNFERVYCSKCGKPLISTNIYQEVKNKNSAEVHR